MSSARSTNVYITTNVMRKMLVSGSKMLEVNKSTVDALNVFPVPDGDTGTNMSLTMSTAIREIAELSTANMADMAHILSKGVLRGARGNSGVILSQIIKGFSDVIAKSDSVDSKTFAKGITAGATLAYSAVSKPKEGTILTVIRCMGEYAMDIAKKTSDIQTFLEKVIAEGEVVLQKTPDMLDVLKKAGVVDSGGYGLIVLFKGMLMGYLDQEIVGAVDLETSASSSKFDSPVDMVVDFDSLDDIEFGYCTEFFVINIKKKTTMADIDRLREYLNEIGNSVVTVGDLSMVKVHVHTNRPDKALAKALTLGEVDKIKIDNMMEQSRVLRAKYDSERKSIGILTICSGEGIGAIFKDLLADQVIEGGQTMNPSAEDIASAIKKINAENIIVLPNNKNIILSAEQSRALVTNRNIYVLQSKDMQMGLSAIIEFDPEASVNDNLANMNEAMTRIRSGSLTFAVRDTEVEGVKITKGDVIGLDMGQITMAGQDLYDTANSLVDSMVSDDSDIITLYYGHDVTEERAEQFSAEIAERYPDKEVAVYNGGQALYYYLISVE